MRDNLVVGLFLPFFTRTGHNVSVDTNREAVAREILHRDLVSFYLGLNRNIVGRFGSRHVLDNGIVRCTAFNRSSHVDGHLGNRFERPLLWHSSYHLVGLGRT